MELIRVYTQQDLYFEEGISLCFDAFPHAERRDREELLRVLKNPDYHFEVLVEEGRFLGIMLFWQTQDFLYLEHFSTMPSLRGQGLGCKALTLLKEKGHTIVLEIEPPADDLTRRRSGFYQRNGFVPTSHFHIQPKYHVGDADLQLQILSYPHGIGAEEYERFYKYLKKEVQNPLA